MINFMLCVFNHNLKKNGDSREKSDPGPGQESQGLNCSPDFNCVTLPQTVASLGMLRGLSESLTDGAEVTAVPVQGNTWGGSQPLRLGKRGPGSALGLLLPPASELLR